MGITGNYGQAAVGPTAVQVIARTSDLRDRIVLTNLSATPVYIGKSSDVDDTTGQLLAGVIGYQLILNNREDVYAIAPSLDPGSTVQVAYVEELK